MGKGGRVIYLYVGVASECVSEGGLFICMLVWAVEVWLFSCI